MAVHGAEIIPRETYCNHVAAVMWPVWAECEEEGRKSVGKVNEEQTAKLWQFSGFLQRAVPR